MTAAARQSRAAAVNRFRGDHQPRPSSFLEDLIQPPGDDVLAAFLSLSDQFFEFPDPRLECLDLQPMPLLTDVELLAEILSKLLVDFIPLRVGLAPSNCASAHPPGAPAMTRRPTGCFVRHPPADWDHSAHHRRRGSRHGSGLQARRRHSPA